MATVSVIIPTYRRVESLRRTLESLRAQTLADFEILVVDNAADPEVARAVGEQHAPNRARYVAHATGGNSGARNRGALEAKGSLLVYTDDDLTFEPGWLEAYCREFDRHPQMVAAGGCVRPLWEVEPPIWLHEFIGGAKVCGIFALMEPFAEVTFGAQAFFFSCNMAIRRSVFKWTGFHPEMFGTRTIGDGETGLLEDIRRGRGLVGYVPDAVAHHHISASRMTVAYIRRWAAHLSATEMYGRWLNRRRSLAALVREAVSVGRPHLGKWLLDLVTRRCDDPKALARQFQACLGWWKLRYVWWMLTDSRVKAALDMTDFRAIKPGREDAF